MKRQQISEREHVEAEEQASRHRDELLEELREREAARRTPSPPPAQTTPEAAAPESTPGSEEPSEG